MSVQANQTDEPHGKPLTGPTAFDRIVVKVDAQRLVVEARNSPWMIGLTLAVFFFFGSIFLGPGQSLVQRLVPAIASWTLGIVLVTILIMGKEQLVLDRRLDRFEYKPRYRRTSVFAPLRRAPEPTVLWDTDLGRLAPYRLRFQGQRI
jgi:hypothetical protein